MKKGKITSVLADKNFFFIDRDYFCHFKSVKFKPIPEMEVEYEAIIGSNGKKQANNVKALALPSDIMVEYYLLLDGGYFDESGFLLEDFILNFPQKLARRFQSDSNVNKPSQLRKYFNQIQIIEGRYKIKRQFQYVKIELSKIIPLLNSAKSKGHISEELLEFMEKNIELAKESETNFSNGFVIHLQSLIAYYKI